MKYTIEGFSQEVAIEYGFDVKDVVFLRWLLDFHATGIMEKHIIDGQDYYWVFYKYAIKQIPIMNIKSPYTLGRRLKGLSAVLELRMLATGQGNKTCFRFKEDALVRLLASNPHDSKVRWVSTQKSGGSCLKSQVESYSSINDSSINDKRGEPFPPTIEQIRVYCLERKNQVDPEAFFNFYESKGWMIGNNKMKDWRAAVRTWERRNKEQGLHSGGNGKAVNWDPIIADSLGKIATDVMIKALLRKIPENLWWKVDSFLKKRYPQSGSSVFLRVETELIRESKSQ